VPREMGGQLEGRHVPVAVNSVVFCEYAAGVLANIADTKGLCYILCEL
jgi:hypothetical protein